MHCNNCGTLVTGKEDKCPGCGMSIKKQIAERKRIHDTLTMTPVQEEPPKEEKKNKKTIGYILLLIGIILISIALILQHNYKIKKEKEEFNQKETVIENSYLYEGYQFIIPTGFKLTKSNQYGIVLTGKDIIYTIDIDQNNSYTIYKKDFENYYREIVKDKTKINNLYLTVLDREYLIDPIIAGEEQATMYATINEKYNTFVGLIVKKDYSKIEPIDLEILTIFFKNVELKEEKKEDENDSAQIKMYSFTKEDFLFE